MCYFLNKPIDHLDEKARVDLRRDPAAREGHLTLFRKMEAIGRRSAAIVLAGCTRHSLFPLLCLTNPMAPTTKWEERQPLCLPVLPRLKAGFAQPRVRWSSFKSLSRVGTLLLGNRMAAFCLTGQFCLTMARRRRS